MKKYEIYLTVSLPVSRAQKIQTQCDAERPLFAKAYDCNSVGEVVQAIAKRSLEILTNSVVVEMTGEGIVEIDKPEKEQADSVKAVLDHI